MSGTKRLLLAVAVLVLGARCIIVPDRRVYVPPPPPAVVVTPPPYHPAPPPPAPPPPRPVPPPPPPPRFISEGEAINIGNRYCQSHAIPCDLQGAHLAGDTWKVQFKVRGPGEGGHVHLDIDARNGAMLHVDENIHGRGGH